MRALIAAGLLTLLPVTAGRAADTSATTLESDLAPEIATELIATYDGAVKAPPGFEPFQALYLRFETVRKWEAFLDAAKVANLDETNGPYKAVSAAEAILAAHGITRVSIATAAIEKLAGVGDWKATDQAQAELVIDELGVLLTEIADPTQRIRGQLVLAGVELNTAAPQAARIRVTTALHDLHLVPDATQQLDFGRKLSEIVLSLNDPQSIEIVSEIVEGMTTPSGRAALTDEVAARLARQFSDRLTAAKPSDALGFAWGYQAGRLNGESAELQQAIDAFADAIDPLPVAILLASGVAAEERQQICEALVVRMIDAGGTIRALNLRKTLLPSDCTPVTAGRLASALAKDRLDGIALPLVDTVLDAIEHDGYVPAVGELKMLTSTLVALGAADRIAAHAASLQRLMPGADFAAVNGRAAVVAMLRDSTMRGARLARPFNDAIAGYAPAGQMAAIIAGTPPRPGQTPPTAGDDDVALFGEIGARLGQAADAEPRLVTFLKGDAPLTYRIALAEGITSVQSFRVAPDDELSAALATLDESAGNTPHLALSASLGKLDVATLPDDPAQRDRLLLRLARHASWAGDSAGADALAAQSTVPEAVRLDIAAIDGALGAFDRATTAIRSAPLASDRVREFRFLARARAGALDVNGWLAKSQLSPPGAAVRVIRASTAATEATTVAKTELMTVSTAGGSTPGATVAPPMPGLDLQTDQVISKAPYPSGGDGGVVVGGEGRYVRLARFESPSFDGQQNNGVRDYVYQQNKTITPEFIFLNTGVFTIADVIAGIGRGDVGAITLLPGGKVRINRPIAVGPDATLIVSGQEVSELQLNGTLGAYVVNAGRLFILGTRVVAFDTDRNGPAYVEKGRPGDKFRPFILSWSASETYVADSEFVAMGYSAGRSYGLSLTSGPADDFFARAQAAPPTGMVVNNSFDNSYYGFYAYEAEGVQVIGNEYRNSIIYGIDPHDRSHHLNLSLNAAYGTFKKHGIIISREVDDSTIAGNLTFDNHGSGIMLDRASVGTVIVGNTVRGNEGDGIAVFESPCTLIGANEVSFNHRSGVLVRNSWDVMLSSNQIASNKSAAIQGFISDLSVADGSEGRNFDVDPYQPFTTVAIHGNWISSNGAGIQTAGVSADELFDNHFRDQSKRLFGGDLDGLNAVLLQNSGKLPTLVTTNCRPVLTAPKQCLLGETGAVLAASGRYSNGATGNYCIGDAGTPQAAAFHGGAL